MDLKVIENESVPVYETDKGIKVVNGRELHHILQSGQDFSTWVKKRLAECDALENEDFHRFHKKMEANNATIIEYIIKLDTAKEMAMLERNEKGKQVRRYFIEVEKTVSQARSKVAAEMKVPVELLTGEDEETCKKQAKAILNFAKPTNYPGTRSNNKPHTNESHADDGMRAFAQQLFGGK